MTTRIFVSHSSQDNSFCRLLVSELRKYDTNVWYDEQNLGSGQLVETIQQEISSRSIFILVLSKAACKSAWVKNEALWAYNLYQRNKGRMILPVTATVITPSHFDDWLFLEGFKRIEAEKFHPYPSQERILHTIEMLQLSPKVELAQPARQEQLDLALEIDRLLKDKKYEDAIAVINTVILKDSTLLNMWLNKAYAHAALGHYYSNWKVGKLGLAVSHYGQAMGAFIFARNVDPSVVVPDYLLQALNSIIPSLINNKDYPSALTLLQQMATYNDTIDWLWNEIAILQIDMRAYTASLESVEHALLLNPQLVISWIYKGNALFALKRYKEALETYNRALEIEPTNASAKSNVCLTTWKMQHIEAARKDLRFEQR